MFHWFKVIFRVSSVSLPRFYNKLSLLANIRLLPIIHTQLSDPAPCHEILVKIYIVVKPLKKGLDRGWRNFQYPIFVKGALSC